ncbi:fluoride efflux transporter FluC [Trueperella pecoris]|uniref:Fluoride-specific ion channel FluC n=1 Tax=Trueperella pecoris TaxID=2733571 RepID=A0A7M1QY77_9ACTO|nr:CrcB family protein [Trueperella pecoris]QOR46414.1 CrcB family protein [Trueperella pecoris]QTG76239.1 CrcB family protein [Trueperella pecoris]
MIEILFVALGAGFGAAARYGADQALPKPWGTVVVNFLGSFLLGIVVGVLANIDLRAEAETYALLGTGFCGGFTTFSTASLEVLKIGHNDSAQRAVIFAVGMAIGSVALAALGIALGLFIAR